MAAKEVSAGRVREGGPPLGFRSYVCEDTATHKHVVPRGKVKMGVITQEREFGVRVCPRRRGGNLSEWRRRREANWKVKSPVPDCRLRVDPTPPPTPIGLVPRATQKEYRERIDNLTCFPVFQKSFGKSLSSIERGGASPYFQGGKGVVRLCFAFSACSNEEKGERGLWKFSTI